MELRKSFINLTFLKIRNTSFLKFGFVAVRTPTVRDPLLTQFHGHNTLLLTIVYVL